MIADIVLTETELITMTTTMDGGEIDDFYLYGQEVPFTRWVGWFVTTKGIELIIFYSTLGVRKPGPRMIHA